jgi:hypothetical protein
MKTITRLALCGVILAAAVVAHAESTAFDRVPVGTLGQNYGELSFGFADIRRAAPNFYNLNLNGNLPLTRHLDLGGGLATGWFDRHLVNNTTALGVSLTAYRPHEGAAPFFTTGLGYQWWNVGAPDTWTWKVATGVQVPFGEFTVTPRLSYEDDFLRGAMSAQQVTAETEVNRWLSRAAAVFASVGYTDVHRSRFDSWNWRAGVRLAF